MEQAFFAIQLIGSSITAIYLAWRRRSIDLAWVAGRGIPTKIQAKRSVALILIGLSMMAVIKFSAEHHLHGFIIIPTVLFYYLPWLGGQGTLWLAFGGVPDKWITPKQKGPES